MCNQTPAPKKKLAAHNPRNPGHTPPTHHAPHHKTGANMKRASVWPLIKCVREHVHTSARARYTHYINQTHRNAITSQSRNNTPTTGCRFSGFLRREAQHNIISMRRHICCVFECIARVYRWTLAPGTRNSINPHFAANTHNPDTRSQQTHSAEDPIFIWSGSHVIVCDCCLMGFTISLVVRYRTHTFSSVWMRATFLQEFRNARGGFSRCFVAGILMFSYLAPDDRHTNDLRGLWTCPPTS